MKKKLAYLLLFVSMTIQGQTIYYVSTTGNDASGTGTSSNPWKTLYKACNSVTTSGSIIHVNAGTYLENTRCILAPGISIEGEGNSTIITNTSLTSRINYGPNGSNGDAIINMVSSSVSNGNQEIRNLKFDGSGLTSSHALYIMNRNNVKIHNCTFVDFNYCAVVWWASGTGDGVAPPTRLSGSEFYSNNVTNCAGYNQPDGSFYGALYCGGHTGMLIHDNIMIENAHSVGNQGWPIKFWLWGGMMLNCKIYNNYLEKTDFSVWDFVIESTGEDGMEIYNNTMIGGIDLNKQNYSGVYPWSVYIHDNLIGPSTEISALSVSGITLEWNNSHVLIERNIIQNCSPGILFTPRATAQTEVIIRYNILKNIKTSSYYTEGITMNPLGTGTTIDGLYIYNNVIEGTANSTDYGIRLVHAGGSAIASATNVKIINNIILNFNGYNGSYLYLTGAGTFSNLSVQNNLLYNNGNSNNALITGTPASYTNSGNKIGNPLFVGGSPYSYQIQSGSPAKDAGLDIGLTSDYLNNVVPYNVTPDIGAYEFGALGVPGYISSAIENTAPAVLEMTYNLNLANIVPDPSSFTVMVNSVNRTVSSVTINATKVLLTLSSPVINGDVVTVAYNKPATNPLQTPSGGQAPALTASVVVNRVNPIIPVYVSSAIQNATPTLLEVTYNLTLANITPATSAFIVTVNSAAITVNSVVINGSKIQLTLASAVIFGDNVTVAYNKPTTNPLQTSSGGQAASISAQPVTNNCVAISPVYVSSSIENATPSMLTMTYNQALANIVPASSAFAVQVNSVSRAIGLVAIVSGKVQLTLSAAVVFGDVVTVSYTKPATNPLQTSSGGQAASISAQSVTNNCGAISPVYVSSSIENATPSVLTMTYNQALANIVPASSAFAVQVNSVSRAIGSVAIVSGKVQLTLSAAVVFGDVVTVSYTKPATNPLQTSSGGQAASISAQSVTNNCGAISPVYVSSSIENATPSVLTMTYNQALANIVPASSAFAVQVNSVSRAIGSVAIVSGKVQLTLSAAVVFGDVVTVSYTKPATNPLQTSSGGQAASISAQSVTNNCGAISPVYVSSSIENATPSVLTMTYNQALANIVPASSAFAVQVNSVSRAIGSVAIVSGKVQLTLSTAVVFGDVVTVSYTKPATNPLQTSSGGQAASISAQSVTNNCVAISPVYVSSSIENATPSMLTMTYNQALANIVPASSAFAVQVNSVSRAIGSVAIVSGKVQLTLSAAVVFGDVVTVSYTKPATNPLQTSSGGQAASISAQPVTNNCVAISPVYVSSSIENATPSVLTMTYNQALANIVPASSAFAVQVNSVSRVIRSVSIVGGKVQLTLSTAVVFGDVVTVSYTKPATNPLQTSSGGQAASIYSSAVINNIIYVNAPPNIVINYSKSVYSGFVGEIDASLSYDANKDPLKFEWIIPGNLEVNSKTGQKIQFLAPIVRYSKMISIILNLTDGYSIQTKSIPVTILPYRSRYTRVKTTRIITDGSKSDDNPYNLIDDNTETKWLSNGSDQWLIFELEHPFEINYIEVAFQKDVNTEAHFDIWASVDNLIWEPLLIDATSSSFAEGYQIFVIPEPKNTTKYSFVKLINHGNQENLSVNMSEFALFGTPDLGEYNLNLYPNPAKTQVNIMIEGPDTGLSEAAGISNGIIRVYNIEGQMVAEQILDPNIRTILLPLNIKSGTYFVNLISNGATLAVQKLIIIN